MTLATNTIGYYPSLPALAAEVSCLEEESCLAQEPEEAPGRIGRLEVTLPPAPPRN